MGIERFRDISKVPPPERIIDVEECLERIAAVWQRAQIRGRARPPRGVQRFRCLEEAEAARVKRTVDHLQELRAEDGRE